MNNTDSPTSPATDEATAGLPSSKAMTEEQNQMWSRLIETARNARELGFAVAVWTPEEIGTSDIDGLESCVVECGNNWLDMQSGQGAEGDE